ncbi:hypothetical protein AAVH_27013 [Aphelenchoides avenae]|nr:hypothetical protein AAVH_27013 [Aphelenchus avenae]
MLQQPSSSPCRARSRLPRPRHNSPDRVQQAIDRTRQTAIAAAQQDVQQASLINAEVLESLVDRLEKIDEKLSAIGNALQMLTDKMDQPGDNKYENMDGLLEDARRD